MHLSNGLFNGWELIHIVGYTELSGDLFFGQARVPLAFGLYQRDAVAPVFIVNTDEDRVTMAGNENIVLFVDGDTILGEDGDGVVISKATNADE